MCTRPYPDTQEKSTEFLVIRWLISCARRHETLALVNCIIIKGKKEKSKMVDK